MSIDIYEIARQVANKFRFDQHELNSAVASYFYGAGDVIKEQAYHVASESTRPSVLYRPTLSLDGGAWCALYGENLQEGCAGFGDTPEAAMRAFDVAWAGWKK